MAQGFKVYAAILALDVLGNLSQDLPLPLAWTFEVRQRRVLSAPRESKQHKSLGVVSNRRRPQRCH